MAKCIYPILIKDESANYGRHHHDFLWNWVPCGTCKNCLQSRANQWSVRLNAHGKSQHSSYFVTLTYAVAPRSKNGYFTLDKKAIPAFIKRLRQYEKKYNMKISYYATSEYGGKLNRPHYHILLYNVYDERNIIKAWSITDNKTKVTTPIGIVDIGYVEPKSINYVCGYLGKRITIPATTDDDRVKEFNLMSKNLGSSFIDYAGEFYQKTLTPYTILFGNKYPLPRYYKDKIFSITQKKQLSYANFKRARFIEQITPNLTITHEIRSALIREAQRSGKATNPLYSSNL